MAVLSFPKFWIPRQCPLPEGIYRIELEDLSETHLQTQLAGLSYPVGAFVHLHPLLQDKQDNGVFFPEPEKAILKHIFLLAGYLATPLQNAADKGRSCFITVARLDGELGAGQKADFSPLGGGLFGLAKTLNLEWPSVFCRAIDLSPDLSSEQEARRILAEFYDPDMLVAEVGYHLEGRFTLADK